MPTKQAEVKDKSSFFHLMKKKPLESSLIFKILNEMINIDIIMQIFKYEKYRKQNIFIPLYPHLYFCLSGVVPLCSIYH